MQNIRNVKDKLPDEPFSGQNGMQFEGEDDDSSADSQLGRATERLRHLVLTGTFPLDEKLAEARVAELLAVSRTPARLAMAALERDGLLVRLPRRGFRVRSISLAEVVEAIEVRGELEAVAARAIVERGLSDASRAALRDAVAWGDTILAGGAFDAERRRAWCALNDDFHHALVAACGMRPLVAAYHQVNLMPMAAPCDTIFNVAEPNLLLRQLTVAQDDHRRIVSALEAGQAMRAAGLIREHAYRSGENKRRNFPHVDMRTMVMETPGIALVR